MRCRIVASYLDYVFGGLYFLRRSFDGTVNAVVLALSDDDAYNTRANDGCGTCTGDDDDGSSSDADDDNRPSAADNEGSCQEKCQQPYSVSELLSNRKI